MHDCTINNIFMWSIRLRNGQIHSCWWCIRSCTCKPPRKLFTFLFTQPLAQRDYYKKYPPGKFGYFFAKKECEITNLRIFVLNICSKRRWDTLSLTLNSPLVMPQHNELGKWEVSIKVVPDATEKNKTKQKSSVYMSAIADRPFSSQPVTSPSYYR